MRLKKKTYVQIKASATSKIIGEGLANSSGMSGMCIWTLANLLGLFSWSLCMGVVNMPGWPGTMNDN